MTIFIVNSYATHNMTYADVTHTMQAFSITHNCSTRTTILARLKSAYQLDLCVARGLGYQRQG